MNNFDCLIINQLAKCQYLPCVTNQVELLSTKLSTGCVGKIDVELAT